MTERKELIERLRDATEGPRMLMGEAADMLEADATETNFGTMPAAPQEPLAWQYRSRPAVNHEWGEWHTVGYKPKGPECTRFMMRPLFAPPPQPRLTDDEIVEWTDAVIRKEAFNRPIAIEIAKQAARWAEKKVRGEA